MKELDRLEAQIHNLLHRLRGSGVGEDVLNTTKQVASQLFVNAKPLIVAEASTLITKAATEAGTAVGGGLGGQTAEEVTNLILTETVDVGLGKVDEVLGTGDPANPTGDAPAGT